jgi:hypothetical protein
MAGGQEIERVVDAEGRPGERHDPVGIARGGLRHGETVHEPQEAASKQQKGHAEGQQGPTDAAPMPQCSLGVRAPCRSV